MRARARTCLIRVHVLTRASAACLSQSIDEVIIDETVFELLGTIALTELVDAIDSAAPRSAVGACRASSPRSSTSRASRRSRRCAAATAGRRRRRQRQRAAAGSRLPPLPWRGARWEAVPGPLGAVGRARALASIAPRSGWSRGRCEASVREAVGGVRRRRARWREGQQPYHRDGRAGGGWRRSRGGVRRVPQLYSAGENGGEYGSM